MEAINYTEEELDYIMSNEYIINTVRKLKNHYFNSSLEEFCEIYEHEMSKINNDALFSIFVEINDRLNKICE